MTKNPRILASTAEWLKSEIIRREHTVVGANQELEDLYRRLEEIQKELGLC